MLAFLSMPPKNHLLESDSSGGEGLAKSSKAYSTYNGKESFVLDIAVLSSWLVNHPLRLREFSNTKSA